MIDENGLCWVSVGGNPCEPARLHDGEIFTIGCSDGTKLEDGCGIEVVQEISENKIPPTPAEQKKLEEEWQLERERSRRHGYRRFE